MDEMINTNGFSIHLIYSETKLTATSAELLCSCDCLTQTFADIRIDIKAPRRNLSYKRKKKIVNEN